MHLLIENKDRVLDYEAVAKSMVRLRLIFTGCQGPNYASLDPRNLYVPCRNVATKTSLNED